MKFLQLQVQLLQLDFYINFISSLASKLPSIAFLQNYFSIKMKGLFKHHRNHHLDHPDRKHPADRL